MFEGLGEEVFSFTVGIALLSGVLLYVLKEGLSLVLWQRWVFRTKFKAFEVEHRLTRPSQIMFMVRYRSGEFVCSCFECYSYRGECSKHLYALLHDLPE